MRESLCVLILEEFAGEGRKVFVAQALEEDMATQVAPGATLLDAVDALGQMFDTSDVLHELEPDAHEPPPAPLAYYHAWEKNSFIIGRMKLGKSRWGHVRLLRDGYAIAIYGRKRPEVVKSE